MRRNSLIMILVVSLATNVAVLVTVGYHYYRNTCLLQSETCPLSSDVQHLYQSLGLSESQLSKVEPLARTFHERLEEMTGTMGDKRDQLVSLLSQEQVNHDQIERFRKKLAATQDGIQREVITHILELKEVLSPEQKQRFFDLMRESLGRGEGPWSPKNIGG